MAPKYFKNASNDNQNGKKGTILSKIANPYNCKRKIVN